MGNLEYLLGDIKASKMHYEEAEEICRSKRHNHLLAQVLESMGRRESLYGDREVAKKHFKEAEQLCRGLPEPSYIDLANVLLAMGELERYQKNTEKAEEYYMEAKQLYHNLHNHLGLANVLLEMGDLEYLRKNPEEAKKYYKEAEEKYNVVQDYCGLANVQRGMGHLELDYGDNTDTAIGHFLSAHKWYGEEQMPRAQAICEASVCLAYAIKDDKDNALKYMDKAKSALNTDDKKLVEVINLRINEAQRLLDKNP
jgi:tetratricopeptide (TPR) repeat protein